MHNFNAKKWIGIQYFMFITSWSIKVRVIYRILVWVGWRLRWLLILSIKVSMSLLSFMSFSILWRSLIKISVKDLFLRLNNKWKYYNRPIKLRLSWTKNVNYHSFSSNTIWYILRYFLKYIWKMLQIRLVSIP